MATGELRTVRLGTVEYRRAHELQQRLRTLRQADACPDTLLLLEHPPVYTRGRRSTAAELPMGEAWYLGQGVDVVDTDRGGRVTYHGPGQLVGYPIMRAGRVTDFVCAIERALVAALAAEDLAASTRADEGAELTGVWVEDRKIASIGVHVAGGVSTHGFAVNVRNDLQPFSWITPCGLQDVQMTSILKETGGADPGQAGFDGFADVVARAFAAEHGLSVVAATADALGDDGA